MSYNMELDMDKSTNKSVVKILLSSQENDTLDAGFTPITDNSTALPRSLESPTSPHFFERVNEELSDLNKAMSSPWLLNSKRSSPNRESTKRVHLTPGADIYHPPRNDIRRTPGADVSHDLMMEGLGAFDFSMRHILSPSDVRSPSDIRSKDVSYMDFLSKPWRSDSCEMIQHPLESIQEEYSLHDDSRKVLFSEMDANAQEFDPCFASNSSSGNFSTPTKAGRSGVSALMADLSGIPGGGVMQSWPAATSPGRQQSHEHNLPMGLITPTKDYVYHNEAQPTSYNHETGRVVGPVGSHYAQQPMRHDQLQTHQSAYPRHSAYHLPHQQMYHKQDRQRTELARPHDSNHMHSTRPPFHYREQNREQQQSGAQKLTKNQPKSVVAPTNVPRKEKMFAASRQDLIESPVSKATYKNISKEFKSRLQREYGICDAIAYAMDACRHHSSKVKLKLYLDIADVLKRHNKGDKAKLFHKVVCKAQPANNQGWIEWSKLEEDAGDVETSLKIIRKGLRTCHYNEVLMTKAIKQLERLHNFAGARHMLHKLKQEAIEKAWKGILEGALFEARVGNIIVAREMLQSLICKIPWYGPIYNEAFRIEEKAGQFDRALGIINRGLKELPRYGPLWLGLIRLMERLDTSEEIKEWISGEATPRLMRLHAECQRAYHSISRELVWKVHFEEALAEERACEIVAVAMHLKRRMPLELCRDELFKPVRMSLLHSLLCCPQNLRWKVLLSGARTEIAAGREQTARTLLQNALAEVPEKSKFHVFLDYARMEEYYENYDAARAFLCRAKREIANEWKIYYEIAMMEARLGNLIEAISVAMEATRIYSGAGRLWALVIMLSHRMQWKRRFAVVHGDMIPDSQQLLFDAVSSVPKSGEVWCEVARSCMNPLFLDNFDLTEAQRTLSYAILFTPQYGDSFIEYVRLEIISQVILPCVLRSVGIPVTMFMSQVLDKDVESDSYGLYRDCQSKKCPVSSMIYVNRDHRQGVLRAIQDLKHHLSCCVSDYDKVILDNLNRRCANADPNYGTAWFYCRIRATDTPREVIRSARELIMHEVFSAQEIYVRAVLNYVERVVRQESFVCDVSLLSPISVSATTMSWDQKDVSFGDPNVFNLEELRDDLDLVQKISRQKSKTRRILGLDNVVAASQGTVHCQQDFITASISLSRYLFSDQLPKELKRKRLFTSDQINP